MNWAYSRVQSQSLAVRVFCLCFRCAGWFPLKRQSRLLKTYILFSVSINVCDLLNVGGALYWIFHVILHLLFFFFAFHVYSARILMIHFCVAVTRLTVDSQILHYFFLLFSKTNEYWIGFNTQVNCVLNVYLYESNNQPLLFASSITALFKQNPKI